MDSLNRRVNSYQHTIIFNIIRIITEGIEAVGRGMERQHDEDIMVMKKSPKKPL